MHALTAVGRPAVVFGGLLLVAVFTGPAGPAQVRVALAALAGTNLTVEGLKRLVGRTRPDGDRKRSNSSFPSSHAANAFAIAWVLGRRWRRLAAVLLAAAALIAFSRMYLNRHFLTDVAAGAALGLAWTEWMARALDRRLRPKTAAAADAEGHADRE